MADEEKKDEAPKMVIDRARWTSKFGRQGYAFQHGIATPGELGPLSVSTANHEAIAGEVGQDLIAKSWSIISKFANDGGKVPCNSCGERIAVDEVQFCTSCIAFVFCKPCYDQPLGNPHFHLCKPHPAWGPLVD